MPTKRVEFWLLELSLTATKSETANATACLYTLNSYLIMKHLTPLQSILILMLIRHPEPSSKCHNLQTSPSPDICLHHASSVNPGRPEGFSQIKAQARREHSELKHPLKTKPPSLVLWQLRALSPKAQGSKVYKTSKPCFKAESTET